MEGVSFQALPGAKRAEVAQALFGAFEDDFRRRGVSEGGACAFLDQNFRAHNDLLTFWDGDRLASTAAYTFSDKCYVCNVWTAPELRGRGWARRAVHAAERALAERHAPRHVYLWCEKDLVGLYAALGYRTKTSGFQVGRDKFVEVMAKKLGA
jgi:ribosomal protein S18 acetylase RimI-like enzyme